MIERFSNLLQEVNTARLSLSPEEIYHLLLSFNNDQVNICNKLVQEVADHTLNLNKVLIMGDTNGILLAETLCRTCDVNWIDFVSTDKKNAEIRDCYININNLNKSYSSINVEPKDYSEDETSYDLIVCIDYLCEVKVGPTYAFINSASKKLIAEKTSLKNDWSFSTHGGTNLLIGYLPV